MCMKTGRPLVAVNAVQISRHPSLAHSKDIGHSLQSKPLGILHSHIQKTSATRCSPNLSVSHAFKRHRFQLTSKWHLRFPPCSFLLSCLLSFIISKLNFQKNNIMGPPNTPSHPHSERHRSARPPSGRRRSASPSARSGSYNARHRSTIIENDTWCRCCIRTAADSLMRPPESFRSTRIGDRSLRHGRVGCSRLPKCKMRSRHPSTCHC